jgi:hypothetical protein
MPTIYVVKAIGVVRDGARVDLTPGSEAFVTDEELRELNKDAPNHFRLRWDKERPDVLPRLETGPTIEVEGQPDRSPRITQGTDDL